MTHLKLDADTDGGGASGLMALVVAVLEILLETMQLEAIRRMESGTLTAPEIERLGQQLQSIESEIASIKEREGIDEEVDRLRDDLNELVSDAIEQVHHEEGLAK